MAHLFSVEHDSVNLQCGIYTYPDQSEDTDTTDATDATDAMREMRITDISSHHQQQLHDDLENQHHAPKIPFIYTYNQERTSLLKGPYWFIQQYNVIHVFSIGDSFFLHGRDDDAGEHVATFELVRGIDTFRCSEWLPERLNNRIEHLLKNNVDMARDFNDLKSLLQKPIHTNRERLTSPLGIRVSQSQDYRSTPYYSQEYRLANDPQNIILFSHETSKLMLLRLEPHVRHPMELYKFDINVLLTYPCSVLVEDLDGIYIPTQGSSERRLFSKDSILFMLFGGGKPQEWDTLYLIDIGNFPHSVTCMDASHVSHNLIRQRRETQAVKRSAHKIIYGFGCKPRLDSTTECIYDDLWELDLKTWKWTEIGQYGASRPVMRGGASMVMHPTEDLLILSGGYYPPEQNFRNDIWILNLRTNHWLKVIPTVMDDLEIDTMGYHSSVICGNHLWTCNVEEMLHVYLPDFGIHPTQKLLKIRRAKNEYCDCIIECFD